MDFRGSKIYYKEKDTEGETNIKTKTFTLFIAIIFLAFFAQAANAQYDVTDTSFIPVSSEECGSKMADCAYATFTGALISLNDSEIGTNVTRIVDLLKNISTYPQAPTFNGTINATIFIWNESGTNDTLKITNYTIVNASNPSPNRPNTTTIRDALTKGQPTIVGAVVYNRTTGVAISPHMVRIVAINFTPKIVNDSNGVPHAMTPVLVYDPYYNVTWPTEIDEPITPGTPSIPHIPIFGQWGVLEDQASFLAITPPNPPFTNIPTVPEYKPKKPKYAITPNGGPPRP